MDLDLIRVEKRVLRFPTTPSDAATTSSDTLTVQSLSDSDLAFKVKTTNQTRYIVRPNVGVLRPHAALSILIGLHASPEAPTPGLSKDKFLLCVAEAPNTAEEGLPDDYWSQREQEKGVQGFKFKVEFVPEHAFAALEQPPDEVQPVRALPQPAEATPPPRQRDLPPALAPPPPTPPGNVVASAVVIDPSSAPSTPLAPTPLPLRAAPTDPHPGIVAPVDADHLLQDRNYEAAVARVRELQALLDAKNLELARLRTELAETKAESERVLKEAPKTPLPANKFLADPFGGVSVAGFGLMLLLFLVLVNVILRIV